jgi:hypothetical protein
VPQARESAQAAVSAARRLHVIEQRQRVERLGDDGIAPQSATVSQSVLPVMRMTAGGGVCV